MQCYVPYCKNTSINAPKSHGITFHKFPTEPRVCAAWLRAIGRQVSQLPHDTLICSQHFLTEDFSVTRSGLKKIRPGAVPFVLKGNELSGINQDKLDIACGNSDNIKIKNETSNELVNNGIVIKQEPLDSDWTETWNNVYDMHIDVLKEELTEKRSEVEYVCESYINAGNTHIDVNAKNEISELHKLQELSENEETKCWDTGHNMMTYVKLEHSQSEPIRPAGFAQTLGSPLGKKYTTTKSTCLDPTSKFVQQPQGRLYKVQHDKRSRRKTISERCFKCDICNFMFTKKCNLKKHVITHTRDKPFTCDFCDRKCSSKKCLIKHMRSHTGERPYPCIVCNFKFTTSGNLKKHMNTHTGVKPFNCDICESKFKWKGSLIVHARSHTGEKPFSCGICGNKFTTKCNLMAHVTKHSGKKPFACNICERKYLTKGSLVVHMRNHTGERPFSCGICDLKFTTKGNSNKHRIHHHHHINQ